MPAAPSGLSVEPSGLKVDASPCAVERADVRSVEMKPDAAEAPGKYRTCVFARIAREDFGDESQSAAVKCVESPEHLVEPVRFEEFEGRQLREEFRVEVVSSRLGSQELNDPLVSEDE